MRLLFVTNHFPPAHVGGYELLCAQVAAALRTRGHEVVVLTSGEGPDEAHVRRRLVFDPSAPVGAIGATNRPCIASVLKECASDVAVVWNTYGVGHEAVFETLGPRIPTTCYLMLHDLAYYGPPSLRAFRLIASSQLIRFHFLRRGFSSHLLPLVYPGVEVPRSCRAHGDGGMRALFCGRLLPYKGIHVAIRALALLPSSFTLTVAGAADPRADHGEELRRLVREHGLEDRVVFLGHLSHEETLALYLTHDVLLFPSLWEEPLGLVVLEAMAAGIPVLASRRGAPLELITHGRTGLFHDPGDYRGLTEHLQALADPCLRVRLGRAAREDVTRRFSFERFLADLEHELLALGRS